MLQASKRALLDHATHASASGPPTAHHVDGEAQGWPNADFGRRPKNVPVPFFFQPDTADTFATLEPVADDVFLASMPKGGTTWTHKMIHLLLHGLDDDGQPVPEAASSIGAKGQVYPEALPLEPVTSEAEPGSPEAMRRGFMGTWHCGGTINPQVILNQQLWYTVWRLESST